MSTAPLPSANAPDHVATENDEGSGRLRLVRLRLTLALLAAAILPVAIVAPVLRMVGDDTERSETARLQAVTRDLGSAITVELEGTGRALQLIAGGPGRGVLGGDKPDSAETALTALIDESPFVLGAELADTKGAAVATAGAAPSALGKTALAKVGKAANGAVLTAALANPPGDRLAVITPVVRDKKVVGFARIDVSLSALVETALHGPWPAGRTIVLRDGVADTPRFQADEPGGVGALPGQVLGRALDPATGLDGHASAALDAEGFGGWTVEVTEPFVVGSVPLAPLGALFLACVALVVLVAWMARQVLRPAAELEASRARLGVLYEAEREVSLKDHLTGLGNHRAFQEELSRQFDQSNRYHVPLAVLLLDLDEFKQVNDTLGHAVGDDLLAEIGRIIRQTVRQADRAFRTGGDEFAIVLPHTGPEGAQDLGRRLLKRSLEDRTSGRYLKPISFSGGIATAPLHATDRTQLLARADAALYRSKRQGRTLVTTFDVAVDQPNLDDATLADLSARVAKVIASKTLRPAYQPIVHLESGRTIAYEGLIRPAPDSGFESPIALFGAAEVTGRIIELDRACLEVVVAGAQSVPEDVFISLNISPRSFEAPEFSAAAFLGILRRYRIAPNRVILELTERDAIHDLDRLRGALEECRAAGVQIAADDVGAGNAGLRLLSQIQFDVMKIDLSLVQAMAGREPVASVLTSLVDLGRRWRALIVAEGVETPEQLQMIRSLGIESAQGYLLGRPGPLRAAVQQDVAALATSDASAWWAKRPSPGISGAAVH